MDPGRRYSKTEVWKLCLASLLSGQLSTAAVRASRNRLARARHARPPAPPSGPDGWDPQAASTPRSSCDLAAIHCQRGHGDCRNPGSALCRGGSSRPWRARRLTLQLKGLPGSLSCRRPGSGQGAAPGPFAASEAHLSPSAWLYRQGPVASEDPIGGFRPGRRDGEGTMSPPLVLIGWILMKPGHSRSIGPAVHPCLQKIDQHLSGLKKTPRQTINNAKYVGR